MAQKRETNNICGVHCVKIGNKQCSARDKRDGKRERICKGDATRNTSDNKEKRGSFNFHISP